MKKKEKTPWPTAAVMTQIYEMHLWGGKNFDFYSGAGSHDFEITTPYLKSIIAFLESHNNSLTVCDLGCGDFNIGKHLTKYSKKYIAVDIVESLIERNKKLFKEDNLAFHALDISKQELPPADCIILRQVLQHLSNQEIQKVVEKLINYKYVILTEHIPLGHFSPNKDIISGQGIRLKQNSGVNILEVPFSLKIKSSHELGSFTKANQKGKIITILYQLF